MQLRLSNQPSGLKPEQRFSCCDFVQSVACSVTTDQNHISSVGNTELIFHTATNLYQISSTRQSTVTPYMFRSCFPWQPSSDLSLTLSTTQGIFVATGWPCLSSWLLTDNERSLSWGLRFTTLMSWHDSQTRQIKYNNNHGITNGTK